MVCHRLPVHQDTVSDPDAILVPPLGRDRWVALAALEPVPLSRRGGAAAHMETVERAVARPHAVGRCEVGSR